MKLLLLELLLLSALVAFGLTIQPGDGPQAELLGQVNQKREALGLTTLVTSTLLTKVAQAHSADMAAKDYLAHGSPEGRHASHRLARAGYKAVAWGEVIAGGVDTPAMVLAGWLDSPAHREVILSDLYTEIGIGYADNETSRYRWYWVMVLADPMRK